MKYLPRLLLPLVIFALILSGPAPAATPVERIVAVVGDTAITASDLDARIRLALMAANLADSQDTRARVLGPVLQGLVNEQLQIQEAERLGLRVTKKETEETFADLAKQNNMDKDTFSRTLAKSGANVNTLKDQIRAQLAWNRVVARTVRPKVSIGPEEVAEILTALEASRGKPEYHLAEIYLPISSLDSEGEIGALAERLAEQIRKGADFKAIAGQFSQGAGAVQGGDIGWIQTGQLTGAVDDVLPEMKIGELRGPVRSLTGFHILLLRDKRVRPEDAELPSEDQISQQLGMQRLNMLQSRLLNDLRAGAFIDIRLGRK
ncbi:MAG: peptidylprolyl isomerase [Pseudomonadota bacterium]|nr:peptidylprolyl isomerase [Pseudomonadota bacterium]